MRLGEEELLPHRADRCTRSGCPWNRGARSATEEARRARP